MRVSLLDVVREQAARSKDFRQLSSRCLGAWPVSVLECLEQLALESGPAQEAAIRLADDAQEGFAEDLSPVEGLPAEHPLDGDWRFAPGVPETILRRLRDAAGKGGRILLACVPTLVLAAARLRMSHQIVVAVRNGDPLSEALRGLVPGALYLDFDELGGLGASAGVIDPPWYDDVAAPLAQRVCGGICEGGVLLVCGPDLLTAASSARPLIGNSIDLYPGLAPVGRTSRVRYRTPLFESRALQVAGIRNVPAFWRTGLLRPFVRSGTSDSAMLPLAPDTGWVEVPSRSGRIWLRASMAQGRKARIVVTDSVSRTSPLRATASAWTSSNTVMIGGTVDAIRKLALGPAAPASGLVGKIEESDAKPCWRRRVSQRPKLAPSEHGWDNSHELRESGVPAVLSEV